MYGSVASAEPKEDTVKKIPTQIRTFFLPYFWVGHPPVNAPTTVPHKAIDIIKNPCNHGAVCHRSWMSLSAPEITTVSNPKIKPAKAAINEIPNNELLFL